MLTGVCLLKDCSSFLYKVFSGYVPYSRRNKYTKKIRDFVNSDDSVLEFPVSLNTIERKWVHQIAEQWKTLDHQSFGLPPNRYIVVSKKQTQGIYQM